MIYLYQNYYVDPDETRNKELITCLNNNLANANIDRIMLVYEPDKGEIPPEHPKIQAIKSDQRPTFNDFFRLFNLIAQPDDISILSNTDIYLPESAIPYIIQGMKPDICMALSRHDHRGDHIHLFNQPDSQDTWIIKGKPKTLELGQFWLGVNGSDNKLAYELDMAGYKVINPAKTIQTIHMHNSNVRRSSADFKLRLKPPYKLLPVTAL